MARMRIVISVSESGAFESSSANNQISEMCDYVRADQGESLLIPQPGKLMDLIKILKEHDIRYHVQDLPSSRRE
jgi:hypothetical protein